MEKNKARFWLYFNFADFRAYFGHFSLVKKAKNGQTFRSKFAYKFMVEFCFLSHGSILCIKRHHKFTPLYWFGIFTTRQHALVYININRNFHCICVYYTISVNSMQCADRSCIISHWSGDHISIDFIQVAKTITIYHGAPSNIDHIRSCNCNI